ncbi:MAG: hypothetical protein ABSD96_13985 [Candidatus Korobacteraceae bacterium]
MARTVVRVMGSLLLLGCCTWAQDGNSAPSLDPGLSFQGIPQAKWQKPSADASLLPDAPSPQPVTQGDKFQAWIDEARSPLIFGAAGLNAMALREAQERGAAGMQSSFTSLYGASVVQRQSSAFLGKFLYPSLLKQDPRYYPSTSRNIFCRTAYAASRLVITRNDEGRATVNTSYLLGVLTSAAVATAYRPYWARTSAAVFADFGSTIGSDAGMNVFHEFWPAIHNKLQGHSPGFVQKIEKFSDRLVGDQPQPEPTVAR